MTATQTNQTQKMLLAFGLGALAIFLVNKYSKSTHPQSKASFDGDYFGADGLEIYDEDSDYDFTSEPDLEMANDGEFFYAKGGKGGLKRWNRRVKILTKKLAMAQKGVIKHTHKVDMWQKKLDHAKAKVQELSTK